MAQNAGGKNKKYGRGKRTPSNAMQRQRTERNKARRIKKAAERIAKDAARLFEMVVERGTARRIARKGIQRKEGV